MVDIKMKSIRERLSRNFYRLEYVNSALNVADMFTKALPMTTYRTMVQLLLHDRECESSDEPAPPKTKK